MWQAAMLSRTDYKFPSHRQFVGATDQTPEEQAAMWRHIAGTLKLKKKTKKRKTRIVQFPETARG